jgi:hypothetical protein
MSPTDTRELQKIVRSAVSRIALRGARAGVVARMPGADPVTLRSGEPVVTLTGDPGEIVLWVSGRDAVELQFDGDPQAVGELRVLQRGF